MRRFLFLGLLILLVGLSVYPSFASPNPNDGLYGMAQYFPANTEVFLTTRIDEGFIQEIDDFYVNVAGNLTELGIPSMRLTQLAQFALGMNFDDILGWLGDYGAFAQYSPADDSSMFAPDLFYGVLLLDDPASADEFLTETLSGFTRTEVDDTIVFTDEFFLEIVITSSTLEMYFSGFEPSLSEGTLLETDHYQNAVTELPFDVYNMGLYFNADILFTQQIPPEQVEIIDSNLGGVAVGFTIVDDVTLIGDVAHAPLEFNTYDGSGQVEPAFLGNIPDTMTSVVVASDASHVITTSIDSLDMMAEQLDEDSPSTQLESQFAELGIDLQADVLDWMTGDYAVFGDTDLVPIVKDALAFELNLSGRIEMGVISDASADPIAAQRLADRLTTLMMESPQDEDVTIRQDVIGGTGVTVIAINTQMQNPLIQVECNQPPAMSDLSFELVLGATDELFVFATRPLADTLLSGNYQGIDTTSIYQEATQYFLPDPTSIWFTDGEGFAHSVVFNPVAVLTLLGPQIGCIFENIIAQLETEATATPPPTPTPIPSPTPDFNQIDQQVRPLEIVQSLIHSASITSTIKDNGVIQVRFVLTYNP